MPETPSLGEEEDVGFNPLEEERGLSLDDLRQPDQGLVLPGNSPLLQLQNARLHGQINAPR